MNRLDHGEGGTWRPAEAVDRRPETIRVWEARLEMLARWVLSERRAPEEVREVAAEIRDLCAEARRRAFEGAGAAHDAGEHSREPGQPEADAGAEPAERRADPGRCAWCGEPRHPEESAGACPSCTAKNLGPWPEVEALAASYVESIIEADERANQAERERDEARAALAIAREALENLRRMLPRPEVSDVAREVAHVLRRMGEV